MAPRARARGNCECPRTTRAPHAAHPKRICTLTRGGCSISDVSPDVHLTLQLRPGGLLDLGEEVRDGVEREVREETGIRATFRSILASRHQHGAAFGRDDLYSGVCATQPEVLHALFLVRCVTVELADASTLDSRSQSSMRLLASACWSRALHTGHTGHTGRTGRTGHTGHTGHMGAGIDIGMDMGMVWT